MSWRKERIEPVYSLLDKTHEVACIGLLIIGADIPRRGKWSQRCKAFYNRALEVMLGNIMHINVQDADDGDNVIRVFQVKKETETAYIQDLLYDRVYPIRSEFKASVEFTDNRSSGVNFVFSTFYMLGVDGGRLTEVLHTIADEGFTKVFDAQQSQHECEYDEDD